MKKLVLVISIVVVIALGAFSYFKYFKNKNLSEINPKNGDVVESIYGLGTVLSDHVYHVRAGLSLTVKNLYVIEGDHVKKNQTLVQLDDSIFKSPLEGIVTQATYKTGELVPPQANVLTITDLNKLFLEISLEQQSVLRVKKGQHVKVSFESLRNSKFEGLVKQVYPREKQFIVRVDLEKWPEGVLPGMTADVAIIVGQRTNVILIPLSAINSGKVMRTRNGKAEKIDVEVGVIDENWAEVLSGNIETTDSLVVKGK